MNRKDEKPWVVARLHGEPKRHKSRADAVNAVIRDLESLKESWVRLGDRDAIDAVSVLLRQVDDLPAEGGKVYGVCDPFTGMKYSAEVRKDEL